ncbi:hypothetical protein [Aliihoeflea sp. 40Bstr573]|uniref:hypothetical protein n=1 Tax=Aliihoeflea sp. 40Bstr573 TaxID=2696467 RepID=UPI002095E8BC|nr:hypothetical protein [Aliihoeflea sp. 40Bstr573]MCO6388936.1 hypothetical protein [Aliihoeflea sp. 40Bstr573]
MSSSDQNSLAEQLMDRLRSAARMAGDRRRLGTLARLVEACDEILSGAAYHRAKSVGENPESFNPQFPKLNPRIIETYVRLRKRTEKGSSEWTGPVGTTIRADRELRDYVKLRFAEVSAPKRSKARSNRAHQLEEIVNTVPGLTGQAMLRQALAEGRQWKRQFDILSAALRQGPVADIEGLRKGRLSITDISSLSSREQEILQHFVCRLKDAKTLAEFGLTYSGDRIKMDYAPGSDLVVAEELRLLEKMAGLGDPGAVGG